MVPGQPWVQKYSVRASDVDYLTNLLLERETPLTTRELAVALIDAWLAKQATALQERYKDTLVYNPSEQYEIGQRLVFPALENKTAVVVEKRPGKNPDYGDFTVVAVEFDETDDSARERREFATGLTTPHRLSQESSNGNDLLAIANFPTSEEVLAANSDTILSTLDKHLQASDNLVQVTQRWFPVDLILDVDVGTLHLAEAVLDMAGGGPLPTSEILEQIGKIDDSPLELQVFS